jgi:hypothetical protein
MIHAIALELGPLCSSGGCNYTCNCFRTRLHCSSGTWFDTSNCFRTGLPCSSGECYNACIYFRDWDNLVLVGRAMIPKTASELMIGFI